MMTFFWHDTFNTGASRTFDRVIGHFIAKRIRNMAARKKCQTMGGVCE